MPTNTDEPRDGSQSPLERGRDHLSASRWESARASFREALEVEESPEALEGLSWAAWWLDDAEAVFEARERAYLLYRKRHRSTDAARMAIWLGVDHLDFRGALAPARGWLGRADRLLDGTDAGPEHGWLAFHRGYLAQATAELDQAEELARRTADLGVELAVPDLEMLGIALQGAIRVTRGEVERGMALLDEATAAAVAGEAVLPISGAWTCCFLVSACEQVRDYPRAFEWCREIESFSQRYGSGYMLGFCRSHFGMVHLVGGRWTEAETALEGAVEAYRRSRPAYVPGALCTLAELRRRQGREEEAERLLEEVGDEDAGAVCRVRLSLDRGEALRAAELAERVLRRLPRDRALDRAPLLELVVEAHAGRGETAPAQAALDELREIARVVTTPLLAAAVEMAAGTVAAATGHHDDARRHLENAADRYAGSGAPFEAASAGMALARTLATLGRGEAAVREARTARERFAELGARAGLRRAERLLAALEPRGDPGPLPELTPREREVLRQVAAGLTNREVGERLHISEHTVHRHVANILRKLDVPSRTAAVSVAARAGLLLDPEA